MTVMAAPQPVAITYSQAGQQLFDSFVTGANGQLDVSYWNGSRWQWADRGTPPATTISGAPGVISYLEGGKQLFDVFVTGANGHLGLKYWNGSAWNWADQGTPPGTSMQGSPAPINYAAGATQITEALVTGVNGHLDVNHWNGSSWKWADQGAPPGTTASASPGVITYLAGSTQITEAFVTGANGHLDVNYWTGSSWHWADQGTPTGTTVSGIPATLVNEQGSKPLLDVFVTGANGHLFVNYWNGSAWNWADQGVPPGTTVSGNPQVTSYLQGGQLLVDVFVTGANGHLFVNYWNGSRWRWADQGTPPATTISGAPGVVSYLQGGKRLFDVFVIGGQRSFGCEPLEWIGVAMG